MTQNYAIERTSSIDVHDDAAVGHLCVHFHCDPNTLDEIGTTPPVPGKGVCKQIKKKKSREIFK